MLDTLNPNTPKDNPQTAMQGIEISEQTAENLTPNQNKIVDELLQNPQHLQESQTTPQTKPTLSQSVEQILDDNTYPTPKQENSAGIEISEQAAENLSKSKDIEARANALIHNTYANLKAQLDNRQGILQAIREQMPQPNNEAQALQAIREQALREQALREKGTLLESISEQAREQNLPKVFNKVENHPLLARIKEQMPTTQQATHLPQTPQQIEQLANDLTQLSREYPQVFKGYAPQLKEVLQNNTDTLFKNGALNKDNFRALLERIDAEITPKATESLAVVKKNLTTENKQLKSNLKDNLSIEEISKEVDKWDLSNPKTSDKLIVSKVGNEELAQLSKEFNFKGSYAVVREIDAQHLAHALNRHSNKAVETSRNQIPITKEEVLNYQDIIKNRDTREVSGNKIIYKKQINGHYVAVEEVLTGKNKLEFVTMWKSKGNITLPPTPSAKGYDLDRTLSGEYDKVIIPQNAVALKNPNDIHYKQEPKTKSLLERIRDLRLTNEKGQKENVILDKISKQLPKQKTINAVDNFAKSADFKALSKDKQQAILRLKEIEPSPMPKEIPSAEFENLLKHFNSKIDKQQREKYLALFADTKGNPDITLVLDGGRREYIKAYQHKESKDLYYLAITENGDKINITGIPTTQTKKVINEIQRSQKVEFARVSQEVTNLANPANKGLNPAVSNTIIPQSSNALQALEQYAPNLADEARLNHLNKDLQELAEKFKLRNTDKENAKLFDRALIVAQQLGVKANLNASTTKQGALGSFNNRTNTIEIFTKDKAKQAETILHELIHATTLKALRADEKLLTPLQKEAAKEVKEAYDILSKDTRLKGEYGISSIEEMLAELSNKSFRDKLEHKGILRRILDAITNLFFKNKTNKSVKYEDLKASLYKIIDNYNVEGNGYGNSTHYKLSPQQKEQRGLYNVTYNGKNATLIKRDLEAVDEALKLTQGYHLEHSQKGKGAKHIRINHLQDPTKQGYITDLELVNLGKDLRTFLKDYAPFVEKQKSGQEARIYEWENKEGVRFRLVSKIQGGGTTADSHLESAEEIITFYSDRNLKERMKFKNPALNDIFYKIAEDIKNPSVFKRTLDAVLDKTIPIGLRDLTQDTINRLGFKTSSNKEYMQLREDILNDTNASVKGVVDFNNLLNAKLSKEQLRELQRYYVGDDYDSKIVTQELKDIADTVMNKINALTQVGIKKGIFPEYYGEMKGYLKRSYEKHTFNAKVPLKSSTLEFHKLFHRGTSKYVSPSTLQRMRDNGEMAVTFKDYKEGKWVISENKDSKGNIEIYRDWSKKEREKMGEIEDFSFNAARTIDTLQKQLYTHDFLKGLEAKKIIIKAESNKAPVGYVDTKGDFGIIGNPFKNYYVKAEVASDLKDTFYKLYGDFSKAQKLLKDAVGLWKAGKTIWNPVSHMNNILGNFTFMIASGEYTAGAYLLKNIAMGNRIFKNYKAYKEAKINNKYLKSGSVTESKDMQLLEELERRGYFDKSFLNVIADNYHLKHNGIKAGKENLLKTFHNWLGNVYNAEDVLARFSLAKSFMEEGMDTDKALKLTSEILPDYSKPMPYWLKNADRLGFLPFVQFIYHATPIMLRQINPRAKSIKGDSWNKQALVNILAIGAYWAYQQFHTPMPDGYFGSEFVYYQNGDTARTIRIGSIVPHIQMLEFLPWSSGHFNFLPEFLRKALVGSVYTQAAGVLGNKNYTFDTKITRRNGALGAIDMVGGAIDFAMPAPVGKAYTTANNALTKDSKNRRSKIHNERNVIESGLGLLG